MKLRLAEDRVQPAPESDFPLNTLERLWLCEAIRLRESQAERLDDREANRVARTAGGDLRRRIETRALWLARRDGQLHAVQHYRHAARLAAWLLAGLAVVSGAGLAFAALGDGRQPVNLFWALGSLLGINLLLLAFSLASLWLNDSNGLLARCWGWLSGRLARDAQAAQMAPALLLLLQQQRLSRWLFGLLSHALWLLALSSALVMLVLQLSTRRYGFVWESTLLGSDSFIWLIQALGALPGLLGFALPDTALIHSSGDAALNDPAARQIWANWLLGVFVVFGILPRLLLVLLCLWRWLSGVRRLGLDLGLPAYQLLRAELLPDSEPLGIINPAPPLPALQPTGSATSSSGALLVAVELDNQRAWPPALPLGVADAGNLDTREQRQQLLDQLSRFPVQRLLIACDPRRSPDRGSLALLGELARNAAATRIWLLPADAGESLDAERLGDWHSALQQLQLAFSDQAPLNWLETGHD